MKTKTNGLTVYSVETRQTSYGQWKVTIDVQIELGSTDSQRFTTTTSNATMIDEGDEFGLAIRCLEDNELDTDIYDLSNLTPGSGSDGAYTTE